MFYLLIIRLVTSTSPYILFIDTSHGYIKFLLCFIYWSFESSCNTLRKDHVTCVDIVLLTLVKVPLGDEDCPKHRTTAGMYWCIDWLVWLAFYPEIKNVSLNRRRAASWEETENNPLVAGRPSPHMFREKASMRLKTK